MLAQVLQALLFAVLVLFGLLVACGWLTAFGAWMVIALLRSSL